MTMEISKTEKALRLIATEGISAKEAAERVGISRAAVSKGKLWPSKSTQNIRKLCEMENEIESLRSELAALKAENETAWAQAHRLALELECLLLDTKDNAIVSTWWDSGMEALNEYQELQPEAAEAAEAWAKMRKAGL